LPADPCGGQPCYSPVSFFFATEKSIPSGSVRSVALHPRTKSPGRQDQNLSLPVLFHPHIRAIKMPVDIHAVYLYIPQFPLLPGYPRKRIAALLFHHDGILTCPLSRSIAPRPPCQEWSLNLSSKSL